MNYLYQITNLVNNKIYIGVHKTDNLYDGYMGSGLLIKAAIIKYGIENFEKSILEFFDTYEEALDAEKKIVTLEFLLRNDVYNLREGGSGGWAHINSLPLDERPNIIEYKNKLEAGLISPGGTEHWTEESYNKVIAQALRNLENMDPNHWKSLTDVQQDEVRKKISAAVSGDGNGSYGTHIYIDSNYDGDKLPPSKILNKNRFKSGEQPSGWITTSEWQDRKKKKSNHAYGKHWYNDGDKNYYLRPTEGTINEKSLKRGRLINNKK